MLPVAIVALACLAAYIVWAPCEVILPMFDSKAVETAESQELSRALETAYTRGKGRESPAALGTLPPPVKVLSVFGRWASIEVAGPMPAGLLEADYGGAWQSVYASHHGGNPPSCVYVTYQWKTGHASTMCCMSQF
jgi:hypothetical protein